MKSHKKDLTILEDDYLKYMVSGICYLSPLPNPDLGLLQSLVRGTKRLVSVNICSVEGNLADIFDSKVSPGIFVIKEK